ncbi:unnamed protein product [Rangifer tarandus platyrhynchus]|uniref:Uncharacterized protein n=2 Tax=Rangifer tarandus platyrhynchus TaxID=3082113 RepID=A0ACB0FIM9_RANTA|nr:unnamed protein product [Rangifer tarandus platyrhynchus]CAI9712722.1 unnamed protein product [Rangifer tarandus platyrhynchus]
MDTSVGPPRSREARCNTHLCACGLEDAPEGISELQPERGWRPLSPGSLPVPPREGRTREPSKRGPGRLGRSAAERALKRRLPRAVDGQRCWSWSRASLASGIRAAPPAPPKVSGAETVPVGASVFPGL